MHQEPVQSIRDRILLQALPEVAFDGWVWDVANRAAQVAGYDKTMAAAVFSGGLQDFVGHFSDWTDRQMLDRLANSDSTAMCVRDRVRAGVMARLDTLSPWREATRRAMTYWMVPTRHFQAGRVLWRSADCLWIWAGDTATDYNHYTKRILLSGVISSTTLAWLDDESGDLGATEDFLDRRIENVMQLGKMLGRQRKQA